MPWNRDDFIAIVKSDLARQLFKDAEINAYVGNWSDDHKAAILHANGITDASDFEKAKLQLQLLSAFGRKDVERIAALVNAGVSVGVRLDYLLPLYDEANGSGEDVFVAAVKVILNSSKLQHGQVVHKVGPQSGKSYDENELRGLENYVASSFVIRKILMSATNKSSVQPTTEAIEYILANATTYRDTNDNPVIVFIPGALNIDGYTTSDLIMRTIQNGANVNDVGFFGSSGIVWSTILGDVDAVKTFLFYIAKPNIEDEFGNKTVMTWASATSQADVDSDYKNRLISIFKMLQLSSPNIDEVIENFSGNSAVDYLDNESKNFIYQRTAHSAQNTSSDFPKLNFSF